MHKLETIHHAGVRVTLFVGDAEGGVADRLYCRCRRRGRSRLFSTYSREMSVARTFAQLLAGTAAREKAKQEAGGGGEPKALPINLSF